MNISFFFSQLTIDDLWIFLTAVAVAESCASIGVFVSLRKMSMLGDAMSHSVLLGIVAGFLIFSSASPLLLFAGALIVAIATGYLTEILSTRARLSEDASIGVNFTWMFALGVVLLSVYAGDIDLDQECVLYGELAFVAFDQWSPFGTALGPKALWRALAACLCVAVFLFFGRRSLVSIAFDRSFALSSGVAVRTWDFFLLSVLAFVVVSAFESVGAILVIALLSIPAASAYLFARSPWRMFVIANLHALLACCGGFLLARLCDTSLAASLAACAGAIFTFELAFSKRKS